MAAILAGMLYYHPASVTACSYFITTPIVSNARGKVNRGKRYRKPATTKGRTSSAKSPLFPFRFRQRTSQPVGVYQKKRLEESKTLVAASTDSIYDVESFEKEMKTALAGEENLKYHQQYLQTVVEENFKAYGLVKTQVPISKGYYSGMVAIVIP